MSKPVGPICAECSSTMYPNKNGVSLILMASFGPYQIWAADEWACRDCGRKVLSGYSGQCHEHFQPGFAEKLDAARRGDYYEVK